MKYALTLLMLLALPASGAAAEKRIYKIDSVIASVKGRTLTVQVKGAVPGGGWVQPRLRGAHGSSPPHTLVLDFVATPPPSDAAVIDGLMPVSAHATLKVKRGIVAVSAQAEANAITTQVLH